jgi:hypothetical protein
LQDGQPLAHDGPLSAMTLVLIYLPLSSRIIHL